MAIAPGSRINPGLARVNYGKKLQAELATGPILTAARLKKSAETIKAANEQMAVYKQKREERELTEQAVAYLQRMAKSEDKATQQALDEYAFDVNNPAEVKQYFKISGGTEKGIANIQESVEALKELYREKEEGRRMAEDIQSAVGYSSTPSTTTTPVDTEGPALSPESQALMKLLDTMTPEEVDKYKDIIQFEDPDEGGKTYGEKYAEELKRFQLETKDKGEQPFLVDFYSGRLKYNEKWKVGEPELRPGDPEYESFRRRYPTLIEELEERRRLSSGSDNSTTAPVTSEFTAEEIAEAKAAYGLK